MTALTAGRPTRRPGHIEATTADFVFAAGADVISGERNRSLDLPALAEVGPAGLAQAAGATVTGRELVCGLIPFDPAERPELFVVAHPERHRRQPDRDASSPPTSAPPTEPIDQAYLAAVAAALDEIDAGALRKVVLARSVDVPLEGVTAAQIWDRLAARNPRGYTFAVRRRDDVFVGASPELVAQVDSGGFTTHPLAGSTPRGAADGDDARRGSTLLASDKDRREHEFVIDHIVRRLHPLLRRLDVPGSPALFATDTMMHLGTRISGALRPGVGALEAALTIHPTPAVCGVPHPSALDAIRRLELRGRGCYAGLVGWSDARGHGQWALALRCAAVRPERARLFAGAGVVRGSTPDAEHRETAAKFATMQAALTRVPHGDADVHAVGGAR